MSSVFFGKPDFSGVPYKLPGGLDFTVGPYSHAAVGGPKQASVTVTGGVEACQALYGLLGCPVVIYNDHNEAVWWGLVEEADTSLDGLATRYSLRDVYNKIRVDYEVVVGDDAGLVATTGWSSDATSITRFKTRELIIRAREKMDATTAAQYLASELAWRKNPQPQEAGAGTDGTGKLICRGYWQTLGLRHLAFESLAVVSYTLITGAGSVAMGGQSLVIAQSFLAPATTTIAALAFYLQSNGTLLESAGDHPDTGLGVYLLSGATAPPSNYFSSYVGKSANVADYLIGEGMKWYVFLLASPGAITSGTKYWAGLAEGGTFGTAFNVRTDPALGYSGGLMRANKWPYGTIQAGQTVNGWSRPTDDFDLPFAAFSQKDSMQVLSDLITIMGTDYLAGASVSGTSGLNVLEVCDDDQNVLDKAESLIQNGTNNTRRVLATVLASRIVSIFEEPTAGTADWLRESVNVLRDPQGHEYELSRCPVGMWVKRANPLAVSLVDGNPLRSFVEEATYDPARGTWTPRFRGQPDVMASSLWQLAGYPQDL